MDPTKALILPTPLQRQDHVALAANTSDPWHRLYLPPSSPRVWVGRLVHWRKEPYPSGNAWYFFDDINPEVRQVKTALKAIENDSLGDTLLARCGADVGWHYLLGVESSAAHHALGWSMAFPLQKVVKGLHAGSWVRLLSLEPGRLRVRCYGDDGHVNHPWDARVLTMTNVFDQHGTHHVSVDLEHDQGTSTVQIPPSLMIDLLSHTHARAPFLSSR